MRYGSPAVGSGEGVTMSGWLDIGRLNQRAKFGSPAIGRGDPGVGSGSPATGGDEPLQFNTVGFLTPPY